MNEDRCKAGGAIEANLGQGLFTIILNISEKKNQKKNPIKKRVYMVEGRENVSENNKPNVVKWSCLESLGEGKQ